MRWQTVRKLKILDFDSECRPMHYSEFRDESQITAIAWSWVGEQKVWCEVLDQNLDNEQSMLDSFLGFYQEADIVTGHYIRRHDLPLLNDHCMRHGWATLQPKLTQDTKDLPSVKALGLSQENLSTLYELDQAKHHMNGSKWASANALTAEGRAEARKRVVSDVRQHKQLRLKLLELGYLKAPRMWAP